jgi:hypothetical protein
MLVKTAGALSMMLVSLLGSAVATPLEAAGPLLSPVLSPREKASVSPLQEGPKAVVPMGECQEFNKDNPPDTAWHSLGYLNVDTSPEEWYKRRERVFKLPTSRYTFTISGEIKVDQKSTMKASDLEISASRAYGKGTGQQFKVSFLATASEDPDYFQILGSYWLTANQSCKKRVLFDSKQVAEILVESRIYKKTG